jgi:serine/threonine protein kinase
MAPEALKGELGLHLDLWSCGIICYLLLAKKMPFTFTSEPELEQKIIKGHYNHKRNQSDI